MGGGEYRTKEGEGSLARDWWNRKLADQESSQEFSQEEAGKASPSNSQETEDLARLTAVVPRQQQQQQPPPWQPAKSKPIDIPKKRTTPPPVFEVAQDKRHSADEE